MAEPKKAFSSILLTACRKQLIGGGAREQRGQLPPTCRQGGKQYQMPPILQT